MMFENLYNSRAFNLHRPWTESDGGIKYPAQQRYTAYFCPIYPYHLGRYEHQAPDDSKLTIFIEELVENIKNEGLLNPVLVRIKEGIQEIHPGKCRVKAFEMLGFPVIPAVIADFDGNIAKKLDLAADMDMMYEIRSTKQLQDHFTGDCEAQMDHRGLKVSKKR